MKADPWKLLEDARAILEHAMTCGKCDASVMDEMARVEGLLGEVLSSGEPSVKGHPDSRSWGTPTFPHPRKCPLSSWGAFSELFP